MSEWNNTPGPWRDSQIKFGGFKVEGTRKDGNNNGYGFGTITVIDASNGHPNNIFPDLIAEDVANAHLIAAAPELAQALEEAIYWDGADEENFDAVWFHLAREALAKAKGEL